MDTQNVKSGQNGQTDVHDDNRVIVKITKVKDIFEQYDTNKKGGKK